MEDNIKYIHIAGTNAKGSVAEYLYQILLAEEISCGVFTSPHLFSPTERIRANGREISEEEYERYIEAAKRRKGEHLFRVWTRAALLWFLDNHVKAAVIEAGIGGKKDCTNTVDAKIAILTPVSLDHTRILGDTTEKIASDKCGIIKPGAVVITYGQEEKVMKIISSACKRKDARLICIAGCETKEAAAKGQTFHYGDMKNLFINAVSPGQAENACAAIEAARVLGVGEKAIREGLRNTVLPARVQIAGPGLVVDGGHNPAAIEELGRTVKELFPFKEVTVLTAVMRDKDAKKIAEGIKKFAGRVVCTCVDRERGLPAFDYAKYFCEAEYCSDARSAYAYAKSYESDVLVVCGSFYLAGMVLDMYKNPSSKTQCFLGTI